MNINSHYYRYGIFTVIILMTVGLIIHFYKEIPPIIEQPVVTSTSPTAATSTPPSTSVNTDLILAIGQTTTISNLSITLNSFVQDNRCPIDVQCIEAGAVTVNVTYKVGSSTKTINMPSDEVPQKFAGYSISIKKIDPPRLSKKTISPIDYVITFHIDSGL